MSILSGFLCFVAVAGLSQTNNRFNEPTIGIHVIDFKAGLEIARETGEPPSNGGVFVINTVPYSPAANKIDPYDLIMYVNGDKIQSAAAFNALVKKSAGDTLILTVCRRMTDKAIRYEITERVQVEVSTLGEMLSAKSKLVDEKDGRKRVEMLSTRSAPVKVEFSVTSSGEVVGVSVVAQRFGESRLKMKSVDVVSGKTLIRLQVDSTAVKSLLLDNSVFYETAPVKAEPAHLKLLEAIASGSDAEVVFRGDNGEEIAGWNNVARGELRTSLDMLAYFQSR